MREDLHLFGHPVIRRSADFVNGKDQQPILWRAAP